MKPDSLRQHAVVSAVTGLALAALVSCTSSTSTHAGPAPSATIPPGAFEPPVPGDVAAGLARIRAASKNNPPGEQWGHYRDEGGTVWYFWPLPDGRFCTGRELHLEEDTTTQDVGCTTDPLPGDATPAVNALDAAGVHGGRWVTFLYADQEEIVDVTCDDRHFTAERIAELTTPYGPRTLYAVRTPWAALGVLHTEARRADGSTTVERVLFPEAVGHTSGEHVCA
ncbi:hypothetical protein [Kitasatospora sp. NPDC101183]|uniref:hypothetical protein n=1 Tax=Kitasatospora sp. NPDC101183 TaxID=3364100 RepID=UPI0037FF2EA6